MRAEYDFEDSKPNPHARRIRRAVTIRLDVEAIEYFKEEAARTGIPYQNLINLILCSALKRRRHLHLPSWSLQGRAL